MSLSTIWKAATKIPARQCLRKTPHFKAKNHAWCSVFCKEYCMREVVSDCVNESIAFCKQNCKKECYHVGPVPRKPVG